MEDYQNGRQSRWKLIYGMQSYFKPTRWFILFNKNALLKASGLLLWIWVCTFSPVTPVVQSNRTSGIKSPGQSRFFLSWLPSILRTQMVSNTFETFRANLRLELKQNSGTRRDTIGTDLSLKTRINSVTKEMNRPSSSTGLETGLAYISLFLANRLGR